MIVKTLRAVALCLFDGTATAQERPDATAQGMQATAADTARVTAIKNRCPVHIGIDVGFTEDLQRALIADGIRQGGKEPFLQIVKSEQGRLRTEIDAFDVTAWCRRQKGLLGKSFPDVFRP
ncbi:MULTISPECIES: hypothetical protein [unclassified Methylobacterium]|uniref:hypothetical protein n=1 Tax=unclassified Methylobacterium TaxID=2615210 RepID=UPI0036F98F63